MRKTNFKLGFRADGEVYKRIQSLPPNPKKTNIS